MKAMLVSAYLLVLGPVVAPVIHGTTIAHLKYTVTETIFQFNWAMH